MRKSLCSFSVCHEKLRLRVKLFATIPEVHQEYERLTGEKIRYTPKTARPDAFFFPAQRAQNKHGGMLVLSQGKKLLNHVTHEVTHAALSHYGHHIGDIVLIEDEERVAWAIGLLSMKILNKLKPHFTA